MSFEVVSIDGVLENSLLSGALCLFMSPYGTLTNHHKGDFNGLFEENKEYLFQKVRGKTGWWVSKSNIKASIRDLLERNFLFPRTY